MINVNILIEEYLSFLESEKIGSVLDLGCGSGRLCLGFAKQGATVLGIDVRDISSPQPNFTFIKQDIRDFHFEKKYDLTISSLILHFLKKERALSILNKIKEHTPPGRFNFIVCLTNKDEYSKAKPENWYPSNEELVQLYSDWDIMKNNSGFTDTEQHDGLPPHNHNISFIIARKRIIP